MLALLVGACGQTASQGTQQLPQYPEEPLPAEVLRLPSLINGDMFEQLDAQVAASEEAMAEMRRRHLPIILRVINLPEDGPAWTVIGFRGAMPEGFTGDRTLDRTARSLCVEWSYRSGLGGFRSVRRNDPTAGGRAVAESSNSY